MQNKVLGLLGITAKAGKIVAGADIVKDLAQRGKLRLVIVAEDASERTQRNMQMVCENNKVPIVTYCKMEELSRAIGQKNRAVIGVKDKSLSAELLKQISGGDFVG